MGTRAEENVPSAKRCYKSQALPQILFSDPMSIIGCQPCALSFPKSDSSHRDENTIHNPMSFRVIFVPGFLRLYNLFSHISTQIRDCLIITDSTSGVCNSSMVFIAFYFLKLASYLFYQSLSVFLETTSLLLLIAYILVFPKALFCCFMWGYYSHRLQLLPIS